MSNLDSPDRLSESTPPPPPMHKTCSTWTLLTGALADWDKCFLVDARCPRLIVYLKIWLVLVVAQPDFV